MAEAGRFLTGSTMGHVIRMTATGALGITFVFLVDAVGLFWLSQLGEPQLVAAVGFAYAIQFFSVSSGVGLMIASTALISRTIGEGDRPRARRIAGASLVVAVVVQTLVAGLVVGFRYQLLGFAGADGETARLAARYLAMTVPSLVPMAVGLVASGALRADGYGAKAMYVTLIAGVVLMVLDPLLIIWTGWGLDGAAIGLVLFRIALAGLGLYYAAVQMNLIARPEIAAIRDMLPAFTALAVPAIATQMSTPTGNYLLTQVMSQFGDQAMAGWAVTARLLVVVFGGIFALSGAIGGIFGQNFGAGQYDRVQSTFRDSLLFCVVYTLIGWALFVLALPLVIWGFGLTGAGVDVLRAFAYVGVGGFVFVAALFVSNAAFNNLGRARSATVSNWIKDGVLNWPAATLLAGMFGAPGVIYGQTLGGVIAGVIATLWASHYIRNLPTQLDRAPPRPYPNPDRYRSR